jgi:eukaryotic-like serine/threonine-protein kinase
LTEQTPEGGLYAGKVLVGKYRLELRVGAGGMGEVYRGVHLTLHMPIAVKILHRHRAAEGDIVRRFYREARASAQLNHPHVVRVLDFGNEGESLPFLVMEWLEGQTLQAYMQQFEMMMPLDDVRDIMLQALSAFEAAHAHGIIHRDVKPENMFVTYTGGARTVKILDFGLAHVKVNKDEDIGPTLTAPDALAGTPEYMSPEQCYSLAVGPESDIYSLGCVLTALLQGKPPFAGKRTVDSIAGHLYMPPPPLARPPGSEPVPALLERLRLDMLAKAPDKRPRTIPDVRERLLAAFDSNSLATALVTRKGDEPLGSRKSRVPQWEEIATTRDIEVLPEFNGEQVMLWTTGLKSGIDEGCSTGLAVQGILLVNVHSVQDILTKKLRVVVLDVADDIDGAVKLLGEIRAKAPTVKTIVCATGLVAQKMTQLVSAGASDAMGSPASPDLLGKKVGRILRRGR